MDGQEQVVTAQEFRLVDRDGRLRAMLGASPESEPGLIFCDGVGGVRMELTLREDGASSLLLSDAAGGISVVVGVPPESALACGQGGGQEGVAMRRAGTSRAIIAAAVAFLGTGAAAAVMLLLWVPTLSPDRLVTFLASMFAVTAGIVTATVAWVCSERRENR